jgi:hypothetical protein
MARSEGLALAPWGVLAGGKIRTNAEEARRKASGEKGRTIFDPNWERTPAEKKVCDTLEEIAKEVGTESITARVSLLPAFVEVFSTERECSRHRVPSAQAPLRVPGHRWPKGRAAERKHRGAGYFADGRASAAHRECVAAQPRLSELVDRELHLLNRRTAELSDDEIG